MKHDGTGWAQRALTDADRAEITATPVPDGIAVYFYGVKPPRPATANRPAEKGWYSASITRWPSKWHAEGSSPIEAYRKALARFEEEEA